VTSNVSNCDWQVLVTAFGHVELFFVYRYKVSRTWTDRHLYHNSFKKRNFSIQQEYILNWSFDQLVCIIWLTGGVNLDKKVDMP